MYKPSCIEALRLPLSGRRRPRLAEPWSQRMLDAADAASQWALVTALLILVALLSSAPAVARQDPAPVRQAVEEFLRVQTRGLPGAASFSVGTIDPQNNLVACPALGAFMPPGARPWGRTTVGVRCLVEGGWSLYVPVTVKVMGEYLVSARPLAQGQMIGDSDILTQSGDLAELPAGILTDPAQAVGKTVSMGVTSGRPLRSDMLRRPLFVQQGQSVKVLSRGAGFQVATDGRALNNAASGQVAQVRTANGQTVSGIARSNGVVEVTY
jgi:flagella basal body P-ring formation protein FlgA